MQLALEDLAARGERKGLEREEELGHVVLGKPDRVQVIEHRLPAHALALAQDHREAGLLAEARIRHAEGGGLLHRGVAVREILDPRRVDVVPAADVV